MRLAWSDHDTAELRRLWALGWSGGRIALELKRTRSSVMGKADRLGLFDSERSPTAAPPPVPRGTFSGVPGGRKRPGKRWTEELLTEKWADRKKRLSK